MILENSALRVVVSPDLGGKITSLILRETGREFLLQRDERAAASGAGRYGAAESYGFDECFPTVAPCAYPSEPYAGMLLPDHGELWSRPWSCVQSVDEEGCPELRLAAKGERLAYEFAKRLSLSDGELRISYRLANVSDAPLWYAWTAHPLLAAEDGCQIVLDGVNEVFVNSSRGEILGTFGDTLTWPVARRRDGSAERLDVFDASVHDRADMFFASAPRGRRAIVRWPSGEQMEFRFDPNFTPYVGIWNTRGGWPEDAARGQCAIAIEPCSAPNSLEQAFARRQASFIAAETATAWSLRILFSIP